MTEPCTESARLARIENKLDTVADILTKLAVQDNEIRHLKDAVKPIPELKQWKDRWGGAVVALSIMGTILGAIATWTKLFEG